MTKWWQLTYSTWCDVVLCLLRVLVVKETCMFVYPQMHQGTAQQRLCQSLRLPGGSSTVSSNICAAHRVKYCPPM